MPRLRNIRQTTQSTEDDLENTVFQKNSARVSATKEGFKRIKTGSI